MKDEYTAQDFAKAVKNPHVGKYIKNGKCIIEVEHNGYNEIIEYDVKTNQKTVLKLIVKDKRIVLEDERVSV